MSKLSTKISLLPLAIAAACTLTPSEAVNREMVTTRPGKGQVVVQVTDWKAENHSISPYKREVVCTYADEGGRIGDLLSAEVVSTGTRSNNLEKPGFNPENLCLSVQNWAPKEGVYLTWTNFQGSRLGDEN